MLNDWNKSSCFYRKNVFNVISEYIIGVHYKQRLKLDFDFKKNHDKH